MTLGTGASRRGRILVVDDDVKLGSAMRRALIQEHDVLTETNAAEALKRLVGGEQFDLVMCDLMMPHMSGMDFYAEGLFNQLQVRVILAVKKLDGARIIKMHPDTRGVFHLGTQSISSSP